MMGLPKDVDMNTVFDNMTEMLNVMRKQLDSDT